MEKFLKKEYQLAMLEPGTQFEYGCYTWTKLDDDIDGGTLVISTEIVQHKTFDENNRNDWRFSSLRSWLNDCKKSGDSVGFLKELIESDGVKLGDFLRITSDLTSDDGMKNYGQAEDTIALLTCDLYRKYRDTIPPVDDWYWTLTSWTCNTSDSSNVRHVSTTGTLHSSSAYGGNLGVRPLCRLKSDILVSVDSDDDEIAECSIIAEYFRETSNEGLRNFIIEAAKELENRLKNSL